MRRNLKPLARLAKLQRINLRESLLSRLCPCPSRATPPPAARRADRETKWQKPSLGDSVRPRPNIDRDFPPINGLRVSRLRVYQNQADRADTDQRYPCQVGPGGASVDAAGLRSRPRI